MAGTACGQDCGAWTPNGTDLFSFGDVISVRKKSMHSTCSFPKTSIFRAVAYGLMTNSRLHPPTYMAPRYADLLRRMGLPQ